jgi:hypothetical protein
MLLCFTRSDSTISTDSTAIPHFTPRDFSRWKFEIVVRPEISGAACGIRAHIGGLLISNAITLSTPGFMAKARVALLQVYLFNGGGIPFPRMLGLTEWASSKSNGHRSDLRGIREQAAKLPSCK